MNIIDLSIILAIGGATLWFLILASGIWIPASKRCSLTVSCPPGQQKKDCC